MLKRSSDKMINTLISAMIAGFLMVLPSTSALALSAEPEIVLQDASLQPLIHGIRHAQSRSSRGQNRQRQYQNSSEQKQAIRSRSEVMQEVKRRYRGAEVLKIALNRSGTSYNVRVLMPSGKVRSLQVSALR